MKYQVIAPLHSFFARTHGDDKFPASLDLSDGYSIRELPHNSLNDAIISFGDSLSARDVDDLNSCSHAIYYEYETSVSGYAGLPPVVEHTIDRILYTLRVVRPTLAGRSIIVFDKPTDNLTIPRELKHLYFNHISYADSDRALLPERSQWFVKSDAVKIQRYLSNVRYLFQNFEGKYHKVLNALIFFEMGQGELNYKPRMVLLVSGLESLFNTSNEQVGYVLKLRCGYFLGQTAAERLDLSKRVRNIYGLRSIFVHGQGLDHDKQYKKLLEDLGKQKELIIDTEQILRRCLQKLLDDQDLIHKFTDVATLVKAFEELVMGSRSELLDTRD